MIEALLLVLALGHYGYGMAASLLGVSEPRVFYIFQGLTGAGFFVLAGLVLHRKTWPVAVHLALYLVAIWGLVEQLLVVGCGWARLYDPIFRAPPGGGLCGGPRGYGLGLAVVAWLALIVGVGIRGRSDN